MGDITLTFQLMENIYTYPDEDNQNELDDINLFSFGVPQEQLKLQFTDEMPTNGT